MGAPLVNEDSPHRKFRYIEVCSSQDLRRTRRGQWSLLDGWLELAERLSPRTPKAVVEGEFVARLPDGSVFKEVSFQTEHPSVEEALPQWAFASGRRWAQVQSTAFVVSDGATVPLADIAFERT